ncbi:MAG: hypothetical protein ABSB35_19975 [Bryobacteraceae bacterium]|jgi:uncharacterized protein YceK
MRVVTRSLVLLAALRLSGCSSISTGPSSAEIFKLQAECANQARQFEADWRRDNGSDFVFLYFKNHYNQTHGRCLVHIYYGNPDLNMETVYDALEGVSKPPIILLIGGNDKAANKTKEHLDLAAKVRDYMEK